MDNEITVIIDDKPATEEQIRKLLAQYKNVDAPIALKRGQTIKHFTWDYAKARAAGLGHV